MRVNEGPKNYYAIPLSPRRFCSYEQLFLNCGLTFKTRFQTGRRETYCPFRRNLTTLSPKLYQSHPGLISKSGRSCIRVTPDLDQSPGGVVSKPPPTWIKVQAELYQSLPRLVSKSGRSCIKVTPDLYPSPGGVVSESPPACIQVRVELYQSHPRLVSKSGWSCLSAGNAGQKTGPRGGGPSASAASPNGWKRKTRWWCRSKRE